MAEEELVQAQQEQPIEVAVVQQEEVIAMDEEIDSDDDFNQPPPLIQLDVHVNIPVLQNPQAWIVDEVPLEDLIPFDELVPQPQQAQDQNANISLGFVEIFIPPVDPSQFLSPSAKGPSAAAVRCWANYFSPLDRSKPTMTMPTEWMDFFTLLLLKPGSFEWAKDFLTSPAWATLSNSFNGNSYSFGLPNSPPSVIISEFSCSKPPLPHCLELDDEDSNAENNPGEKTTKEENVLAGKQPVSTSLNLQELMTPPPSSTVATPPISRKRGKQPIIFEASLRRSERLHKNSKGFKNQICKTKNCLGCSSDPPTLSSSVVRDLGATFYNLDPSSLTDEKLNSKDPKKMPISKPKSKKTKKDNDAKGADKDYEDGGPSTSK